MPMENLFISLGNEITLPGPLLKWEVCASLRILEKKNYRFLVEHTFILQLTADQGEEPTCCSVLVLTSLLSPGVLEPFQYQI